MARTKADQDWIDELISTIDSLRSERANLVAEKASSDRRSKLANDERNLAVEKCGELQEQLQRSLGWIDCKMDQHPVQEKEAPDSGGDPILGHYMKDLDITTKWQA